MLNQKIKNIFLYFDNYLDYAKAKNVHSFSIARSIRYIVTKIRGHSLSYKCHCFKCLVCRLLMTELISREHLKLLLIVTARNYMFITNKFIFDSLEKKGIEVVENILDVSSKLSSIQQFCEFSEDIHKITKCSGNCCNIRIYHDLLRTTVFDPELDYDYRIKCFV